MYQIVQVSPKKFIVAHREVGGAWDMTPGKDPKQVLVQVAKPVTKPADRRTTTDIYLAIITEDKDYLLPKEFERHFIDPDSWCFSRYNYETKQE